MDQSQYNRLSQRLMACHLNDEGAKKFEAGLYDEAVARYVEALRTWEQVECCQTCNCNGCTLDECIRNAQPHAVCAPEKFQHDATGKSLVCTHSPGLIADDVHESDERFVFRHPIYTPQTFQDFTHEPGTTMSLIIILNLAMAYHMSAIQENHCRQKLQKALQLYELAHQLQLEDDICSPRATMIVANNVGEIHRSVQNYSKQAMCLQHLLSTMMYMIDCRVAVNSLELEGFMRNTTQIILHDNCASAA